MAGKLCLSCFRFLLISCLLVVFTPFVGCSNTLLFRRKAVLLTVVNRHFRSRATTAMSASSIALLAAILFAAFSYGQADTYTVLSSVVFIRSGERTPTNLGFTPSVLTSLGAQQAYSAGSFFRNRYVSTATPASNDRKAPIRRLSPNSYDPMQMYILAQDTQATAATAQAFMQGFYPPYVLNESMAAMVDPSSVLANESYVISHPARDSTSSKS